MKESRIVVILKLKLYAIGAFYFYGNNLIIDNEVKNDI